MNWRINAFLILSLINALSCADSGQSNSLGEQHASTTSLAEVEDVVKAGENWKRIDLRKPEEFQKGHIPHALNVWRPAITDTTYPYGGMMPTQPHLEQLLSKLGISPTDTILIYDDKAACDAARLWWILKYYGHQNIKLLNGGLTAWKEAGNETLTDHMAVESSDYEFHTRPDSSLLAIISSVRSIDTSALVLLDTRGETEYLGEFHKKGAAYPGHISGALNLDWGMAVDYGGTKKFLSTETLKTRFDGVGIDGTKPVITYCHSGVRSAHTLFVLTELLGFRNIKNYDGSWIEWSHHNDTLSR